MICWWNQSLFSTIVWKENQVIISLKSFYTTVIYLPQSLVHGINCTQNNQKMLNVFFFAFNRIITTVLSSLLFSPYPKEAKQLLYGCWIIPMKHKHAETVKDIYLQTVISKNSKRSEMKRICLSWDTQIFTIHNNTKVPLEPQVSREWIKDERLHEW